MAPIPKKEAEIMLNTIKMGVIALLLAVTTAGFAQSKPAKPTGRSQRLPSVVTRPAPRLAARTASVEPRAWVANVLRTLTKQKPTRARIAPAEQHARQAVAKTAKRAKKVSAKQAAQIASAALLVRTANARTAKVTRAAAAPVRAAAKKS